MSTEIYEELTLAMISDEDGDFGGILFENHEAELMPKLQQMVESNPDKTSHYIVAPGGDTLMARIFKFKNVPDDFLRFAANELRDYDHNKHEGLFIVHSTKKQ